MPPLQHSPLCPAAESVVSLPYCQRCAGVYSRHVGAGTVIVVVAVVVSVSVIVVSIVLAYIRTVSLA